VARFRGTVKGGRGEASRLGHAKSGLAVAASGWNGHIKVRLSVHGKGEGEDWVHVWHETNNATHLIYLGRLDHHDDPRGQRIPLDVDKLVK
jgi:hypothetical protein